MLAVLKNLVTPYFTAFYEMYWTEATACRLARFQHELKQKSAQ